VSGHLKPVLRPVLWPGLSARALKHAPELVACMSNILDQIALIQVFD